MNSGSTGTNGTSGTARASGAGATRGAGGGSTTTAVATGEALVSVRNLTRRFGDFVAVNNISFDIPRGQIFGFLGPNGCGKTTTIRMLTGLLTPTSGSVTGFGGLDALKQTEVWKHRLGYMSQKFSLYTDLTVDENLRFFGSVYGLQNSELDDRIAMLAKRLRFEKLLRVLTGGLSTGQRQRAALAAALLHEPELLFLDEPTGGVDPRGRRLFWDLIYELAADRGMTVLVTTHYMDEAEQCDRLVLMLSGSVIAEGTPADIKKGLAGRLLEIAPSGDPFTAMNEAQQQPAIEDAYLYGVTLRVVSAPDQRDTAARALAALGEVKPAEPSLEDAFVALVRKREAEAGSTRQD
jgi:ABC-2 type transport system ATP-binding protein